MTGWKFALGATVPAREGAVRVAIIGRMVVRTQCIFEMMDCEQSGKWSERRECSTRDCGIKVGIIYYIDIRSRST